MLHLEQKCMCTNSSDKKRSLDWRGLSAKDAWKGEIRRIIQLNVCMCFCIYARACKRDEISVWTACVSVIHSRELSSRSCDREHTHICTFDCIDVLISAMHCALRVVCTHAYGAKYFLGHRPKAIDGSIMRIIQKKQSNAAADADCPSCHEFTPLRSKSLSQVKPTALLRMQFTLVKPPENGPLCVHTRFLSHASDAAVGAHYSCQSTMPSLVHYKITIYAIIRIIT